MRTTKTTSATVAAPGATQRRALHMTLWALQLLVAFVFGSSGLMKLSGAPEMVTMFAAIGLGQWLRVLVGLLEIGGAIGLVIPRIAGLAALGLSGIMVGAIATNLFVLNADSRVALGLLVLNALIAWGRWSQTKQLLRLRSQLS